MDAREFEKTLKFTTVGKWADLWVGRWHSYLIFYATNGRPLRHRMLVDVRVAGFMLHSEAEDMWKFEKERAKWALIGKFEEIVNNGIFIDDDGKYHRISKNKKIRQA